MENDIAGVRIQPPIVEFLDASANELHTMKISVKNVSKDSKQIKFHGPVTDDFKLKVDNPEKPVASGLHLTATVEYCTEKASDVQDRLILLVDEDIIEIPVYAYSPQPLLDLEGPVDFGTVVCNGKVLTKYASLFNHGSINGDFKLKYEGDLPITITPLSGTVKPQMVQIIKVEFVTKDPGTVDEEVKVKLESQEASSLHIKADVVNRALALISFDNEEPIDCLKFGNAYYGTDRTDGGYLFNNSPNPINFVAVLDEGAIGQEIGIDLTKSTTAALATTDAERSRRSTNDLTSLFTAIPNQGYLAPYQKVPIFFRFSPRWNSTKDGWKCETSEPPRQDFAVFMNLQTVGSKQSFSKEDGDKTASNEAAVVEVALTATALPVLLRLTPQKNYDFGECPVGEHVDTLCTLHNDSPLLPLSYVFRQIAQFNVFPPVGKIKPGQYHEVIFSFKPSQFGNFKSKQVIDILGPVANDQASSNLYPLATHMESVHIVPILFKGNSTPLTTKKAPKFNPGITPLVVGEVGQFTDVTYDQVRSFNPWSAILNATGTKGLHKQKSGKRVTRDDSTLVAFPNDRAASIRPSYRKEEYKTPFTQIERHTYVDPDYGYNDEEIKERKNHKNSYINYLKDCRTNRIEGRKSKEFEKFENQTDMGMKPSAGIKPTKLKAKEIHARYQPSVPPNENTRVLSSKVLTEKEAEFSLQPVKDGLNATPLTAEEKAECKLKLSPQELHQIIIGPPTVDFGDVCVKSVSTKAVSIVNNLDTHIHVVMHVDCRELRQISPLSQVVPPNSKAEVPFIFESNNKGTFHRDVQYTINSHFHDHIVVHAEVVTVALELSSDLLKLTPVPGMPIEAGLRDVITVHNRRNHPAEFTWHPILGERGTAFSIRPATGVVDAFKDLQCEVVFHPSYHAPENGEFALQVHYGPTVKLKCAADLGQTSVIFLERRILFGSVPLHLSTTKVAQLFNTSSNHAYFQVVDPNPFPGLTVSPANGVVPVGGTAELKINLTPTAILKFDTRIEVAIRGWKTVDLRLGGTVEPPVVDIDLSSFHLGGVYCGSSLTVPFGLLNRTRTQAKVEFDLAKFKDFSLKFHGDVMAETTDAARPGIYKVNLSGEEVLGCELTFAPTEVAAYDFMIPVCINQTEPPTPDPSPFPPTPAPSSKSIKHHIITPRPVMFTIATPKRRVTATALREPLQLSHTDLNFTLPAGYFDFGITQGTIGQSKGTVLVNNSDKPIRWNFDLSNVTKALEDGIFKFLHSSGLPFVSLGEPEVGGQLNPGETMPVGVLFCPDKPGNYEATVPVVLNENFRATPYRYITLKGEMKDSQLAFDPLAIALTPVPLSTTISTDFTIKASGYRKASTIEVELPEIELDDGSKASVLSVTFPKGRKIEPCCKEEGQEDPFLLKATITFSAPRPVSCTKPIVFIDSEGKSFSIQVTATADNCLLTSYPFISKHRMDYHIVTEQGKTVKGRYSQSKESLSVGEAVIMPVEVPTRPSTRGSTSTASRFGATTSTYDEDSSASVTESTYPSTPREGAANHLGMVSEEPGEGNITSRSMGSALFPSENTEEGIFHQEVLGAVQRWITLQGWPGGPFPVTIPEGLRSGIGKNTMSESSKRKKPGRSGSWETDSAKKDSFKTIYSLVAHLSGKAIPGIPINQPLPSDPTERVVQLHWQNSTLLTFLKSQGACVAGIKPEFLLESKDYQRWMTLQEQIRARRKEKQSRQKAQVEEEPAEQPLDQPLFELVSKRAWTDLILQILKTLLLARITPRHFKTLPSPGGTTLPTINPDPICSNVYSVGERILLAWLNHHYEQQRNFVWRENTKGGVPPPRWIVNFDFDLLDGLVLATALSAHLPFLVNTHLKEMYTTPATAEQCLHNALTVVSAFTHIGLDYDIQAIDITDPNPVSLLLLCTHLYQRLPHYVPKSTLEFTGALHAPVTRQVRLTNPSNKPLVYHAMIAGRDCTDFRVPQGSHVSIAPKGKLDLDLTFRSRFLRPAEAYLILVGRRAGTACGATLVFSLRTSIDSITPKATIRTESPCYHLEKVAVDITNPFDQSGDFQIVLVESKGDFPGSDRNKNDKDKKKLTKVKSKTDHGQKKERTPTPPKVEDVTSQLESLESDQSNLLSAFYCRTKSIQLKAGQSATVEVDFLPFNTGRRQCSLLFISEAVGEFLYSIEAISQLPLPSTLPFAANQYSVRISSAAAAGTGRGQYGGEEHVIYWCCDSNNTLKEELSLPVSNAARERALMIAGQQRMSEKEIKRRGVTGTLASSSITSTMAAMGIGYDPNSATSHKFMDPTAEDNKASSFGAKLFNVELSSSQFSAPEELAVESPLTRKPKSASQIATSKLNVQRSAAGIVGNTGVVLDEGTVQLPIRFAPRGPGHYPCRVVLKAANDIRVYLIECIVNPEGNAAQIEFTAPVHHSVTQEIPIVNETKQDWPLNSSLSGYGFYGPPFLLAKAQQTTIYSLMFRPTYESLCSGNLVLTNSENGTEHIFNLRGIGEKPLALDHINLSCSAKQSIKYKVKVPNATSKKLQFNVVSDLSIVKGAPSISVLPSREEEYQFTVTPWKRGKFTGVLTFLAEVSETRLEDKDDSDNEEANRQLESGKSEQQSQQQQEEGTIQRDVSKHRSYRVWYSLTVESVPPSPEKTIDIVCAAQSATVMEVGILNPIAKNLTFDIIVEGEGLKGESKVTLTPGQHHMYQLVYAPAIVGKFTGSLIFQNKHVGEFWYTLNLISETPAPTTLSHQECELGKWTRQFIHLSNPTEETLQLIPTISNPVNFTLELEADKKVILLPHTEVDIPLQFMPSALGQGNHHAKITFWSEQLGDWDFFAWGTGLVPVPIDPVSISTTLGSNASIIVPFRNPLDEPVLIDVVLTDNTDTLSKAFGRLEKNRVRAESAFCLLLKTTTNIRVEPRSSLEVPITFVPDNMRRHEALLVVAVKKEDGSAWKHLPANDPDHPYPPRKSEDGKGANGMKDIRWLYPIHGIPESHPASEQGGGGAVVECQARSRIEERLEVSLTGAVPSSATGYKTIRTRAVTPYQLERSKTDGVVVGEGNTVTEEFSYEFIYPNQESRHRLQRLLAINLIRKKRQLDGVVTLVFSIIFSPFKVLSQDIQLKITGATGGVWTFPIKLRSTEPTVDDKIVIEAVGLNKTSTVGFRLNSQARHPIPFSAYFVAKSDSEFQVSPQTGELLPLGTNGTLITLSFTPKLYGKAYQAKLVVQTSEMQWTYDVEGVTPDYEVPRGVSARPIAGPHRLPASHKQPRNYIRDNLQLNTTAVSSPIKGAPILSKSNQAISL